MRKRMTIYEIARDLDLSPGTISKVINNTGNVSLETRKRVLAYIEEVGYVPQISARILKSKRSYSIGVMFSEELNIGLEHTFFSSILQHFKSYAESKGYELSFIVKRLGKNTLSYYQWCLNKRVDGVYIVVGDYNDKEIKELVDSDIPCVSNDMYMDNLHTVIGDNEQGMKLIFDYIRNDLKVKRVSMISGPKRSKAFAERMDFYKENIAKYEFIDEGLIITKGFGFTSGYEGTKKLLEAAKPELIICASDDIALGVLKALKDMEIDVPNDMQVIGFDDINFAKHFTPSLTTVKQDRKALGEKAARDLIEHIENKVNRSNNVVRVPVELIIRETTK